MWETALKRRWKLFFCILTPFLLSPLIFLSDDSKKYKCLYVILLMGAGWMVEALPLPVTALLPVVLFPVLGILNITQLVGAYMRETGMMFIGGISLALAIQHSGLHKRIALNMMVVIGVSPWRLLLGIMVTTFTLSCWIVGNTAVTAMMIPIVAGLVDSVEVSGDSESLRVLYMLSVGYAANIGGTAVMIGSIPNLIFKDLMALEDIGQDGKYTEINFATWIAFNMPIALINLALVWITLGFIYLRQGEKVNRSQKIVKKSKSLSQSELVGLDEVNPTSSSPNETAQMIGQILKEKLAELGPMNFHEKAVTVLFLIAVVLWFTRDPQIFSGWQSLMPFPVGDSSVAVFVLVLMFIIPREWESGDDTVSGSSEKDRIYRTETLMTWDYLQSNFPWGVVLLVGGGFAISDGAQASGFSAWLGEQLNGLESLPQPLLLLLVLIILSVFTEVMSNAATVSLLTPILVALSRRLGLHPLYLSFPGAIACQYAFILPTSNPPNAIVFSAGRMSILDMVKPGLPLNFICLSILYLMTITWGNFLFNFGNYEYAQDNNATWIE